MKFSILLAAVLAFGLSACAEAAKPEEKKDEKK